MNRDQERLLVLLKEFKELCDKNDIPFFAAQGTLLGALRNHGFLPWDDDADVLMRYEDWQRFKEVCKTQLPPNRHLGAPELNESHSHILPRYVDAETTMIHNCQTLHDDVSGYVIDIFVLDPIASKEEFKGYWYDLLLYSAITNYANFSEHRAEVDPKLYEEYLQMQREHGRVYTARKLEERLATHFSEDGELYAFRWQGITMMFERAWFDDVFYVPFEDMMLPAPIGAHGYLSVFFGEEWGLVPATITPGKHVTASSTLFPYTEALEFYQPKHNREALLEDMYRRKTMRLEKAPEENYLRNVTPNIRRAAIESDLRHMSPFRRREFDQALDKRDGAALARILHKYLKWQIAPGTMGRKLVKWSYRFMNPLLADVDPQIFAGLLLALVDNGDTRSVFRLLELYRDEGHEVTPLIQEIEEDISTYKQAQNVYCLRDYRTSVDKLKPLIAKYPHAAIFQRLLCSNLGALLNAGETDVLDELEQTATRGLELFPSDGQFIKAQADCLYATGKKDEAQRLYLQAAEHTRDGVTLFDIASKTGYHPHWERDPQWGKVAGVPQWDGPEPEALQTNEEPAFDFKPVDSCQDYLLSLLAELSRICDTNKIPYILSPATARAIFVEHGLPRRIASYALVLKGRDLLQLVDILEHKLPANRMLRYMGNSGSVGDRSVKYYGTDSLLMNADGSKPSQTGHLYVTLLPAESFTYSTGLERSLSEWSRAKKSFTPSGSRAKLFCTLRRIPKNKVEAGAKLFNLALGNKKDPSKLCLRFGKKKVQLKPEFFEESKVQYCRSFDLRVPKDLEAYCALAPSKVSAAGLKVEAEQVCAASINYDGLVSCGAIEPSKLAATRKAMEKPYPKAKAIERRFRYNFRQIMLSVELKELSLELMPQKEKIIELAQAEDFRSLEQIFKKYLALVQEYSGIGPVSFDDEIFQALQATQEHIRKTV